MSRLLLVGVGLLLAGGAAAQDSEGLGGAGPAPTENPESSPSVEPISDEEASGSDSGVVKSRGRAPTEVDVYGRLLVEQAKAEVYSDLLDAGYTERVRKDDVTVFRHPDPWKGEVHVHDDGWMRVKRQGLQIEGREMPWAKRNSALAWAGCVVWVPLCVRPAGQTMAKRKYRELEARVVGHVQPDVVVWGDRIADVAVFDKVEALPERLEGLWFRGVPLSGDGPALASVAERKAALLDFWETRTDTEWGEDVRRAVEAFIRGIIQGGDQAFTQAEIDAFNARSQAYRPLTLERVVEEQGE